MFIVFFSLKKGNTNNGARALLPPCEEILVSSISTTVTCSSVPHAALSSTLSPASLHRARQAATPAASPAADRPHSTACPLLGTRLGPSPPPATDFYDSRSYFRYAQFAWNGPKVMRWKRYVRAEASSPLAVLQITLHSPISKWQSWGTKEGDESYGKVVCFFFKYLLHSAREIKMTLWSLQCLLLYIAAKKLCSVLL